MAAVIRNHPANRSAEIQTLAYNLADEFGVMYPRFVRRQFLEACGVPAARP